MSRVGHPGTLRTAEAPLVASGDNQLRALARVIGVNQQNYQFDADQVRSVEKYTLQHLAEGKPQYIGSTITSAMQSANASILEVMPMIEAEGITFRHQYYEFVRELAVETPAQAPPNYLEVQESETEATLTRHAIGITTSVQELRTSKGQFFFMGKLIQATVAFVEQAELHAMRALLEQPSFYARYYAARGQYELDLARAGRIKDEYWDILRRSDNGFFELADLVKQDFSMRNLTPSHVIIPEGVRSIISNSDLRTEYYRRGNDAAANAEQLGDSIGETLAGLRIVTVRAYDYEKKDLRIEPLNRRAIIGAHFRMDHFWPNCDLARFCSAYQEIEVFSMDNDEFERIDLETAIHASGRFDAEGRLHDWHADLVGGWSHYTNPNRRSVPIHANEYDMFIYTSVGSDGQRVANVAALWGHMEEWALDDDTVKRTATTIANYVRRNVPQAALNAIAAGIADIDELYELPWSAADLAYATSSPGVGRFGAPRLVPNSAIGAGYKPRGYGSVAGYMELASAAGNPAFAYVDQQMAGRAAAFKNAAAQLHRAFAELFDAGSHPALSPKLVSQIFRSGSGTKNAGRINSMLNFFQNIVDQNKAALYITGVAAGAAPAGLVVVDLADDSPYQGVTSALREAGTVPAVARAFGSQAAVDEFEARFEQSTFARRYTKYLSNKRSVSDDADDGAVFDEQATVLARFVTNEVFTREDSAEQLALLDKAVRYVDQGKAPRSIAAETLDAWASDTAAAQRGQVEAAAGERVAVGLTASIDALNESEDAVKVAVAIQSPLNPGQVLRLDALDADAIAALDGSGSNDNLLRTTIFSGAKNVGAGVRGAPTAAGSAMPRGFDGGLQPTFAADEFVDVVGSERVVNNNIVDRFRRAASTSDWLLRVSTQMFLTAPILHQTLDAFVRNDIALPVAFLVEQFNRRYETASFIYLAQNPAAPVGNVYHLDFDVHVGRDAIRKDIMYHISGYLGAVVSDVRRYFVAHDVVVVGYDGGENTVPFDQSTFNPKGLGQLPRKGPSLLFFMVPAGSLVGKAEGKTPLVHDIRGYSDQIGNSRSASQYQDRPFHKSALYYTTKLGLEQITRPTQEDWYRFDRAPATFNTVTAQGFQRVIDPDSRNFILHINSHDPFKNSVYPGARKLRESKLPQHYRANVYSPNGSIAV